MDIRIITLAVCAAFVAGCSRQDEGAVSASATAPEEFLESVRSAAVALHEKDPSAPVVASGDAKAAAAFIALGEGEEIDAWRFPADVKDSELAELRKTFDASGGKAVAFVKGSDQIVTRYSLPASGKLKGRMASPILVAGTGRVYIVGPDGKVTWEKIGCGNVHRAWLHDGYVYYSNGSLYRVPYPGTGDPTVKPELVWRPEVAKGGGVLGYTIEKDGAIVMAVNSTSEIIELKDGKEVVRFTVDCRNDKGETPGPHGRLRMVRKTAAGTYLVCCAGASKVREYDKSGKMVWEQSVPVMAFDCLRCANGNTLVGHVSGVTEYTPDHKVAWEFKGEDVPSLKLSCLCGVQELPDGNIVIGTWANGEPDGSKATACEINRAKKIAWAWFPKSDANMMSAFRIDATGVLAQ